MKKSPFKFLDAYTKEDRDIFFGREQEVEELYYKIFNGSILIVYGSSGTGKTSLIRCGLANKFNDADWMPVIVRRGNDINESVKKTLRQHALTPLKENSSLAKDIKSIYLDYFRPVYLLFDQFEELFIFGSDEEIEAFTDSLRLALDSELSCKFIFIIRGEYLENISRFEEKIPDFFNNRMRIEHMTRKNIRRVITEPCKLFDIKVTDDFPSLLLENLAGEKSLIELTYLQVYLDKLYKKALSRTRHEPIFDAALLKTVGRIDDILGEFLEEQIAKTTSPEESRLVLKSFVSGEGTKKPMSINEVVNFSGTLGKGLSAETAERYIRQFVDLRILNDQDDDGRYELRHDSLAAKIYEKISLGERELLEVRQFILNRFSDYKKRGIHLEAADISYINPYRNKILLDDEQKLFVENSIKLARKKRLHLRNIITGIAIILFVVLASFTFYAVHQRNEALMLSEVANQKTREALNQKELAEKAKDLSMQASRKALDAKAFAELQKAIADSQTRIANEQTLRANEQSKIARRQKDMAETEAKNAELQTELARQQKLLADQEKEKAETAQAQADRLHLLSLSQNIAFRSLQVKNDPTLAALLSVAAYQVAKDNKGNLQTPELYNALFQSLRNMGSIGYPQVIKCATEIQAIGNTTSGGMIAVSTDGNIYSFDNSGKPTSTPSGYGPVNTAYLSADAMYCVTAYDNYSVAVHDIQRGTTGSILSGHSGLVRAAAISRDGKILATGGRDSVVIVWNSGRQEHKFAFEARLKSVALSPDNRMLLAGCEDGSTYLCDLAHNTKSVLESRPTARVQSAVFSTGGNYIATGTSKGSLSIFSAGGRPVKELSENSSVDYTIVSDELGLLIDALGNRTVHIYNLNDLAQKPIEINDVQTTIRDISLSSDGRLWVACANNTIRGYLVKTGALMDIVYSKINRNLTTQEWSNYIGNDIPFKNIKPDAR